MTLKIIVGVEAQVIVEPFLFTAVVAFDFTVMSGRFVSELHMNDPVFRTEEVKYMDTLRFLCVAKLCAIICLD